MRPSARREMISIKTQHFKLNRILLIAIGIWPYRRTMLVRFHLILFYGILTSFIVFQFTALITAKRNPEIISKVISSTSCFIFFLIKYHAFWIKAQTVKYSLEYLQYFCNKLKDKNEIAIMRKYGNDAKLFTIAVTLFALCSIFAFNCLPFWPFIHDIFLHTNESRPRITLYTQTEYFVDQEMYLTLIMLHTNMASGIGIIAVAATGSMLIAYFKHACGMFRIASYRIEQAMTINTVQNTLLKNDITIYKEIICAVDIHRKAMKFCDILMSNFESSYMFLIPVGVICLSISLFRISRVILVEEDKIKLLLNFMSLSFILVYLFWSNYIGQEIMDHNNHIFLTATVRKNMLTQFPKCISLLCVYNVQWYAAPLHIRRMILFLLLRGHKIFTLSTAKLFTSSFECFASLVSTSMTYFTVLYSLQ